MAIIQLNSLQFSVSQHKLPVPHRIHCFPTIICASGMLSENMQLWLGQIPSSSWCMPHRRSSSSSTTACDSSCDALAGKRLAREASFQSTQRRLLATQASLTNRAGAPAASRACSIRPACGWMHGPPSSPYEHVLRHYTRALPLP